MPIQSPRTFSALVLTCTATILSGCAKPPVRLSSIQSSDNCSIVVEDSRDSSQRGKVAQMFSGVTIIGTGHLVLDATTPPAEALRSRLCARSVPFSKASILRLTASHFYDFHYAKCDVELVVEASSADGKKRDVFQPHSVRDEKTGRPIQEICGQSLDEAFDLLAFRLSDS